MKKALVHEWFASYAGSERCVESFTNIWDDFDVFSLIDFLNDQDREVILKGKKANTSFIQKLPFAKKKYRNYLPLFPLAIEQFDLSDYDLILSSSHAVAKGVLTRADQIHISYVHTPIRYAWDLYHQYLKESGLNKGIKGKLAKYFLHKIRIWDVSTVNRVDHYIANSHYIARRIKNIYRRDATVIYPPVDVEQFEFKKEKSDFYLTASRMVPYKKIDLIVRAFVGMPDKSLVVIGDGPEMKKIQKVAKDHTNISLLGYQDFETLKSHMQNAKSFVFAAEEDFGIIPVEAQACGTPVIAFGKGGARETVLGGKTGVFFEEQTESAIQEAVERFEEMEFDADTIRQHAETFSKERFEKEIKDFVDEKYEDFRKERKNRL